MDYNPYQVPVSTNVPPLPRPGSEAVAVRTKHLNTEASVKGLAWLMIIGGILLLFVAVAEVVDKGAARGMEAIGLAGFMALLAVINFTCATRLLLFKQWARIVMIVLSSLSLLGGALSLLGGGPLAGLIGSSLVNLYVILLLSNAKGGMVFSPYYRQVVAQTPEVKYKSNLLKVVLIMVLVFVVVVGAGIAWVVMTKDSH